MIEAYLGTDETETIETATGDTEIAADEPTPDTSAKDADGAA